MRKKAYRRWKIGSLIFLGVGVFFIIAGYLNYAHAHALLRHAVPATGVVAGYKTSVSSSDTGNDTSEYSPRIRFRASSGQEVEFLASSSDQQKYPVNAAVTVLYNPKNPSDAMLRTDAIGDSSLAGSMIPGGVMLAVGVVGFAMFVFLRKRLAWLLQNGRRISADFVLVLSRGDESLSYYVVCQWIDPETHQTHQFKSHALRSNPQDRIGSRKIDVLIDPDKPKRYWVDLDSVLST
jgi:hypothetical protein